MVLILVSEPMASPGDFSVNNARSQAVDALAPAPAPAPAAPALPTPLLQPLAPITIRLDRDNYPYWRSQFVPTVRAHDLDGFLFGTRPCPPQFLDALDSAKEVCSCTGFRPDRDVPNFGLPVCSPRAGIKGQTGQFQICLEVDTMKLVWRSKLELSEYQLVSIVITTILCRVTIPERISVVESLIIFVMLQSVNIASKTGCRRLPVLTIVSAACRRALRRG
ncbi:hypothetical protein G4B88_008488 [Cannabis sativa]|uniref:Retrotransposon Copia-like N-terminal domain-containing protein n=1 Tax=Cannabis sativa TaxID=3483 RepID=A0A7J6DVG9_CANSA|nr:hypothetical protein G4B88_008488 [Cannabis sativa]